MIYETEQQKIARRQALADMLSNQSQFDPNTRVLNGGMTGAGGYAVPTSAFQVAAKLLQSSLGTYERGQANSQEDALAAQKDQDKQSTINGLVDQLAGPSQMQTPPSTQPAGATTNFESGDGTPQPQMQSDANAQPQEMNQRRAALLSMLKGADKDQVINTLLPQTLQKYEPQKPQIIPDGGQLGVWDPIANKFNVVQENAKDLKPNPDDRQLINIVAKDAPGGYRTIKRSDFQDGMQLYQKPNSTEIALGNLTKNNIDEATEYMAAHDGQLPSGYARNPAMAAKLRDAYYQKLLDSGDSAGAIKAKFEADKADQSALRTVSNKEAAQAAFGKKLDLDIGNLMNAFKAAGDLSSPLATRALREWQQGVQGDKETSKMITHLNAVQGEYAKIKSGSLGNSPASDAAMADAKEVINKYMNLGQIESVADAMRQEQQNNIIANRAEREEIQSRIAGRNPRKGAATSAATPTPATAETPAAPKSSLPLKNAKGWVLHTDKNGNKAYVGPNNEIEEVK